MGAYLAISLAVSLAMAAVSAGLNVRSLAISTKNQNLRNTISNIMNMINKEINAGRLHINKLISLLQSKNQTALMNYLQNNPVISRSLDNLQKDSDLIAEIQAEQSSLESELSSLYAELQSLGYSQDLKGTNKETKRMKEIQQQIAGTKDKYSQLSDKAQQVKISTTNEVVPYTADLDARSQNINGGLNNNGL